MTIPVYIRERAGLLPRSEWEFVLAGDTVRINSAINAARGPRLVAHLRNHGGAVAMSTDEIMALTQED